MAAHGRYIGPTERARFALVNWPEKDPRGGVVICPPLGYEHVSARESLRVLAEALAERGIAAMRINYDGTENSVGADTDPARVQSWLSSIEDAIDEMTAFGFERIALIGLRVGALLASQLTQRPDVSALVEWDPVPSGRRFVRELRLLAKTTVPTPSSPTADTPLPASAGDDEVVYVGVRYPNEALADLSKLTSVSAPTSVRRLTIERDQSESPVSQRSSGDDQTGHAEHVRMAGTRRMLESTAETAVVPLDIVRNIADWVERTAPCSPAAAVLSAGRTIAYSQRDGRALEHEVVRIGPAQLLAVLTRLQGTRPRRAVLMTNNGNASMIGPGGAWVEFAGDLVDDELLAVRVDLSGLGDSPARPGRRESDAYGAAAGVDYSDVVAYLASLGVDTVTVVGLCSGALLAYDGALATERITDVVSINPRFDKPFCDRRRDRPARAAGQSLRVFEFLLSKSPLNTVVDAVPGFVWTVLAALRLVARPSVALQRVLDRRSTTVLLLFSQGERGLAALRRRSARQFEAIARNPRVDIVELESLDHSMFDLAMRAQVLGLVRRRLTTRPP